MEARKVILAGIDDEKMDLFLLLNEGAGYKVVGIVDTAGQGETTQIAEILGVRAYTEEDLDRLPEADIVIYGDDRFRTIGERLGLPSRQVWHQTEAWNYLTDGESRDASETVHGGGSATAAAPAAPVLVPPTPTPGPSAFSGGHAITNELATPETSEPQRTTNKPVHTEPGNVETLGAFAQSLGDLEQLYAWILRRALTDSGAVAGGILPAEPVRPAVWRDRRSLEPGRRPAFLDRVNASGTARVALGLPNQAGSSELVLVGGSASGSDLEPLAKAVGPALQIVAELEDLRRTFAQESLVRDLITRFRSNARGQEALEDLCRAIALKLGARECVLLFRETSGALRGVTSQGGAVSIPAGSALLGVSPGEGVHAVSDATGAWHYAAELGADRRGFLGLYGVPVSPGRGESLSHEVLALARALAEHLPDLAETNGGHA
jgi:hypothetical protein